MNNFFQIAFYAFVICISVLLHFYRQKILELKDVYSQYNAKSELIEVYQERIREIEKQLSGGRNPSSDCIGCKHLIVSSTPLDSAGSVYHPTIKQYNCRKNLHCREYEEETGAKPCL